MTLHLVACILILAAASFPPEDAAGLSRQDVEDMISCKMDIPSGHSWQYIDGRGTVVDFPFSPPTYTLPDK